MKSENIEKLGQLLKVFLTIEPAEDRSAVLNAMSALNDQRAHSPVYQRTQLPKIDDAPSYRSFDPKEVISFRQASKETGVSEQTFYVMARRKQMEVKRTNKGSKGITRAFLEDYMRRRAAKKAGHLEQTN